MHNISLRPAQPADAGPLFLCDALAQVDAARREYLVSQIAARQLWLAESAAGVLGYGVLNYHFFSNGFVELLYVAVERRRAGVGAALMRHCESVCRAPKLFTSTNLSNLPMQGLLTKLGYALTGMVHNLDEGDPELFYFKRISA